MKKAGAWLICLVMFFVVPVTAWAETEPQEPVWDVVAVRPSSELIVTARGTEVVLPDILMVTVENQLGGSSYEYLSAGWVDAPYDTSVCGDFTVYATVYTTVPLFAKEEYLVPVTLRVIEPVPPNLLDSTLVIAPFGEEYYDLEIFHPQPISHCEYMLLEVSLDEGETWLDAREVFADAYFSSGANQFYPLISVFPLAENIIYCFRVKVVVNGVAQGVSECLALMIEEGGDYKAWEHDGNRDGDQREEQPPLPPPPPVEDPDLPVEEPDQPAERQSSSKSSSRRTEKPAGPPEVLPEEPTEILEIVDGDMPPQEADEPYISAFAIPGADAPLPAEGEAPNGQAPAAAPPAAAPPAQEPPAPAAAPPAQTPLAPAWALPGEQDGTDFVPLSDQRPAALTATPPPAATPSPAPAEPSGLDSGAQKKAAGADAAAIGIVAAAVPATWLALRKRRLGRK